MGGAREEGARIQEPGGCGWAKIGRDLGALPRLRGRGEQGDTTWSGKRWKKYVPFWSTFPSIR